MSQAALKLQAFPLLEDVIVVANAAMRARDPRRIVPRLVEGLKGALATAGALPPELLQGDPDALVRRAESLQLTADARAPLASLPSALWAELGLKQGDPVRIAQGEHGLLITAVEAPSLASGAVRVSAGHADTALLGAMFGPVTVTRV